MDTRMAIAMAGDTVKKATPAKAARAGPEPFGAGKLLVPKPFPNFSGIVGCVRRVE